MSDHLDKDATANNASPMEPRFSKTENDIVGIQNDIVGIKLDIATIKVQLTTFATREDLQRELAAQTWRFITFVFGFGTVAIGAVYFIATHF